MKSQRFGFSFCNPKGFGFFFEILKVWVSFFKSVLKVLYLFNVLEISRMIQEVLELSRKLKNVHGGSKKF
jgi:hypothetical protein